MGNTLQVLSQFYPPKSKFSVDDIPDLTGKVIIVTGIGRETIKPLLAHNAKVYMASRSKEKADTAIAALKQETGREAIFLQLDLSDLESVCQSAEEFLNREAELHVLFNNAGLMWPDAKLLSKDGYDLQFGTHVVGHFLFTELLMPALLAGVHSSLDGKARIITTSTSGHVFHALNFDTFREGPARQAMTTRNLYFQSKFGNVVVAREIARRYGDKGIVSISCNPGNLRSDLGRHMNPLLRKLTYYIIHPVEYGALTQLWGGVSPETVDLNGAYLIPWARVGKADPRTSDVELGQKLWMWLEEQVRDYRA